MLSSDDLPHSHAHAHLSSRAVPTSRLTRLITILLLAAVAGATAIGLVVLWPDYAKVGEVAELTQYSAQGVDLEQGEVLSIDDDCTRFDDPMAVPGAEDAADEEKRGRLPRLTPRCGDARRVPEREHRRQRADRAG
ncbi:hypothetical protein [Leucobacter soli]|uniref:hypothetical protein n=1 Tax=Leucobacter soli TaxID=2812850 RepID=UPI003606E2ED